MKNYCIVLLLFLSSCEHELYYQKQQRLHKERLQQRLFTEEKFTTVEPLTVKRSIDEICKYHLSVESCLKNKKRSFVETAMKYEVYLESLNERNYGNCVYPSDIAADGSRCGDRASTVK